MSQETILSIVESTMHPNYTGLYHKNGMIETRVNSVRKAISSIKKQSFDFIVAEFFYAFSTNYSGVHKSNLDVLLISLAKYRPECKLIVLVEKDEREYVEVLEVLNFPIHAVLVHPIKSQEMMSSILGEEVKPALSISSPFKTSAS